MRLLTLLPTYYYLTTYLPTTYLLPHYYLTYVIGGHWRTAGWDYSRLLCSLAIEQSLTVETLGCGMCLALGEGGASDAGLMCCTGR
jgi:hypothetical protein